MHAWKYSQDSHFTFPRGAAGSTVAAPSAISACISSSLARKASSWANGTSIPSSPQATPPSIRPARDLSAEAASSLPFLPSLRPAASMTLRCITWSSAMPPRSLGSGLTAARMALALPLRAFLSLDSYMEANSSDPSRSSAVPLVTDIVRTFLLMSNPGSSESTSLSVA